MGQKQPGLVETLLAIASTATGVWIMMPPIERYYCKMSVLRSLHRLTARLARHEGKLAMGEELETSEQRYGISYRASLARDWIATKLDEMRP